MDIINLESRENEKGFTLVELAVVMIIIGLLIGGILKGQELITNARVTTTASSMESLSAAYNGFRDQFNAIPGDMGNAVTRISGCGAVVSCADAPAANANNGIINTAVGAASAGEGLLFFSHLLAANFISDMNGSSATAGLGVTNPTAPVGGGFLAGDTRGGATAGVFSESTLRAAPHIVLTNAVGGVGGANVGPVTPAQAANIDRRVDDGSPNTGTMAAENDCNIGATGTAYDEDNQAISCSIAYRIQ